MKILNKSQIVTTIREVETPWRKYPWYSPYGFWCDNIGTQYYNTMATTDSRF